MSESVINSGKSVDFETVLKLASDKSGEGKNRFEEALAGLVPEEDRGKIRPHVVLGKLLQQARVDMRAMLAERLAMDERAPIELVLALAHDDMQVAKPILLKSKALTDVDLVYIIQGTDPEYWQAIAQREKIDESVINKLIATEDDVTAVFILNNQTVTLSKKQMASLVKMAYKSDELQEPLMARREFDNQLAAQLYWAVSNELRYTLMSRFNINSKIIDDALESLVQEIVDSSAGQHTVHDNLRKLAKKYAQHEEISGLLLLNVLRRGQVAFFIALLAEKTSLPTKMAKDIVMSNGGKAFAVLAKAYNMRKADFASLFILSRGGKEDQMIVEGNELVKALAHFDKIDPKKSKFLIDMWRSDNNQFYKMVSGGF